MKRAKLLKLRRAIEALSAMLADEEAAEVAELFPQWRAGVHYEGDTRVQRNGDLYKVLIAHDSQADWTPEDSPSLFARVLIPDPDVIPEWVQPDSTNPYMRGDRVKHNGETWESLIDNNVWEPGVVGTETLWREINE